MRKAMICITVMLALLQFWPMVFGQRTMASVAAPSASAAVVVPVPKPVPVVVHVPKPLQAKQSLARPAGQQSCYSRYQAAFAVCTAGDATCRITTADQWDLCEATGFWPT